jgi:serine protease SohB
MRWILPAFGDGDLVTRMAYLPPLEQHYAFEQLNERYFRDWAAWRKAHPTNHALLQSHLHYSGFFKNHTSSATLVGTVGSNNKSDRRAGGIMTLIDAIISRNKYTSLQSKELHRQQHQQAVKVSSLSSRYPHVYNNGTAIVLDMTKLDTQVSSMETIRDQISFLVHLVQSEHEEFFRSKIIGDPMKSNDTATDNITTTASQCDEDQAAHDISAPLLEIIVVLESPGGSVSSYGLVASHLQRLRSTPGIKLTICVDSVAASGGYMIACMASKGQLFAAPFAMIGSIGVIGQSINVQKALEKFGVRPYVFLGGKNKQPVGMLGDVTKDGLEIMQLMINRIHESFRKHVRDAREESLVKAFIEEGGDDQPPNNYFQLGSQTKPSHLQQSLDRVTNGDVFMGAQALKLGLVDRLTTSDEYIAERIQHGTRVLKLVNCHRHVGLSSLLMPTHHSVAWNRWFVRAKNLVSTIFASWLGFDASHSVSSNIQVKMDADLR